MLPSDPNAQRIVYDLDTYDDVEWRAIAYIAKQDYLTVVDAAHSLLLQESLCRKIPADQDKKKADLHKAICALRTQVCLDHFASESAKTEFELLCKSIQQENASFRKIP